MSATILLAIGVLAAVFVGVNIGGSSTGVAFGPAVGSGVVGKIAAAGLMTVFALLGGWTVGRNVIATMGGTIVPGTEFTPFASIAVLSFVGLALLVSNLFGVPASTSMTAVGAIAGLGVAHGVLNRQIMAVILSWWIVAPIMAFWTCAVIGRYLYPHLAARLALDRGDTPLLAWHRVGPLPLPRRHPGAAPRELAGAGLVLVIGCYMAFSAGASNVANAVAPLVGNGALSPSGGVLLAAAAIGAGSFTLARRTLDTVGSGLTDLPLTAALIVETVSATIITVLSAMGIPASLAVSATMCVVGLGWGRATRAVTLTDAVAHPGELAATLLPAEESVEKIGEESVEETRLFDPGATGRVFRLWILAPTLAALLSYGLFTAIRIA